MTAGNGGNEIVVATNLSYFIPDFEFSTIDVTTGTGDDVLVLDAYRFDETELDVNGLGVTVDLGEGNNTLVVDGPFSGSASLDEASIKNVQNLVLAQSSITANSDAALHLYGLRSSLETVQFDGTILTGTDATVTIDGAPSTLEVIFGQGGTFGGDVVIDRVTDLTLTVGSEVLLFAKDLELNDVTDLTVDIGASSFLSFGVGGTASLSASDLTSVTFNFGLGTSSFQGVTYLTPDVNDATTDVNNMTTVTVKDGSTGSDFNMDFDNIQSDAIATIDLSAYKGDAAIRTFSFDDVDTEVLGGFDSNLEITLGSGTVNFEIYDANNPISRFDGAVNRDTFVFTTSFAGVSITGFDAGTIATSDKLDLSVFDNITGAGDLNFTQGTGLDLLITANAGQFSGSIVLVGEWNNVNTISQYDIIYS